MRFTELRKRHVVGRHIKNLGDGGDDWCIRCGTFSIYLEHIDCTPEPRHKRAWRLPYATPEQIAERERRLTGQAV